MARNGFPLQGFSRFRSGAFAVVQGKAGFMLGGRPTAEDAVFPIVSGDTSPCIPGVVIEICSASRFALSRRRRQRRYLRHHACEPPR